MRADCNKHFDKVSIRAHSSQNSNMPSVQEMQRVDRELSLELIESPINPAFLHMSTPLKGYDPMFYLQINGEALWQWRVIKGQNQNQMSCSEALNISEAEPAQGNTFAGFNYLMACF